MSENAKWYVIHTYSGYENAVKTAIEKFVANRHLEDMILDIQIPLLANRFRKGEIRVETLTRSGEWFRENFPVTPPTAVTALTDYREKDRKTVWYNSRYYRTNLLWEGGALCIRDIHMFDQRMESDYYRKAGTTNQCVYTTLPVVDGCMWSTREKLAGLRVMRRTADGSLAQAQGGTPAVTEKGKGKLLVEWPMDDGRKLTIPVSYTHLTLPTILRV